MSHTPIDISEEDGVRYLHFGSEWVQGAMRIRRPVDLELEYTREMMFGLLLQDGYHRNSPWPRKVLIIGLGAGSLAKFCYWKLPQASVTAVEIDAGVWSVARQMFKLPENDRRLCVQIADGAEFMAGPGTKYDYILVDGYDADARVGLLDSLPFYQTCWARLNEGGIVTANLFGRSRRYGPAVRRLQEAFARHGLTLPQSPAGNVVALAMRTEGLICPPDTLRERARQLKTATGLNLLPTVERLTATFPAGDPVTL